VAADLAVPAISTVYVQVPVQASYQGAPFDPTAYVVEFAFVVGSAAPATWYAASWQTTIQGNYLAQCLIGPNGGVVTLGQATYTVWLMITGSPEVPVIPAGSLQIT
jgi:hypothetical protein